MGFPWWSTWWSNRHYIGELKSKTMYRDTEKRGMRGLNMGQRNVDNYGAKLDRPKANVWGCASESQPRIDKCLLHSEKSAHIVIWPKQIITDKGTPPMDSSGTALATLMMVVFFAFIFFLIIRELVCWYYKINQMVAKMDTMIHHLQAIQQFLQIQQPPHPLAPPAAIAINPQNRPSTSSVARPIP